MDERGVGGKLKNSELRTEYPLCAIYSYVHYTGVHHSETNSFCGAQCDVEKKVLQQVRPSSLHNLKPRVKNESAALHLHGLLKGSNVSVH